MSTNAVTEEITYIRAVNEGLRWALREYPKALILGEDVALPNGPFGATRGLHGEFGDRVIDTPITESAFVGAAIGAAMRGYRPIVEIMFMDFTQVAMDQLVNQLPNIHYVSNGGFRVPLTIRTQQGRTPGSCAQHSQSLEAVFAHVPGIRVGLPANPQDAYDMLRSAIASDDPALIIESRALYASRGPVELERPLAPIGRAQLRRPGEDVTIVSWSRMVGEAEAAAQRLEAEGISAAVIDLRWVSPVDHDTIAASLERTGRLVIAHEANRTAGFGAELAAWATEERFWDLDGPVARVGAPDIRMPAAATLQEALLPSAESIAETVRATLNAAPA
ncbi:MAG: acetoin dehydrogenase [Chloroflexi bacterium]|nr:acetoin dehydrogenase [Chloroflexota bacterium]